VTVTLYRFFDQHGALLYVGQTTNLPTRTTWHRTQSPWYPTAASMTFVDFETRTEALAAEAEAIATERPIHNLQGRTYHLDDDDDACPFVNTRQAALLLDCSVWTVARLVGNGSLLPIIADDRASGHVFNRSDVLRIAEHRRCFRNEGVAI